MTHVDCGDPSGDCRRWNALKMCERHPAGLGPSKELTQRGRPRTRPRICPICDGPCSPGSKRCRTCEPAARKLAFVEALADRVCGACLGSLATRRHGKWCSESCRVWAHRHPGEQRPRDHLGAPVRQRQAQLRRTATCSGCEQEFFATRATSKDVFPRACSPACRKLALLAGCRNRRPAVRTPRSCADCGQSVLAPARRCGRCARVRRLAQQRAKTYRRKAMVRAGDFTIADEIAMRTKAKCCPLCAVKLVNQPYLPASKELDHIVPQGVGGTHTHGNVRIICRSCNLRRPKDGSDYIGPVTLWAEVA